MAHIFSLQFQNGNEHYYCWVVPNVRKTEYAVLVTNDVFSEYTFEKYLFQVKDAEIINQKLDDGDLIWAKLRLALQEYLTKEEKRLPADKNPK